MKKYFALLISAVALCAVFTGCGDSTTQDSTGSSTEEQASNFSADSQDEQLPDSRGIDGMNPTAVQMVLESEPFNIDMAYPTPADENSSSAYAYTAVSLGTSADGKISYDYSLTMDSDIELIGGTFGVTSTDISEAELLNAAELYFYAISLIEGEGSDPDALYAWMTDNIANAGNEAISTKNGGAIYEMYAIPGTMYWIDISKAE